MEVAEAEYLLISFDFLTCLGYNKILSCYKVRFLQSSIKYLLTCRVLDLLGVILLQVHKNSIFL